MRVPLFALAVVLCGGFAFIRAVWYTWGNDRSIIDTWHITGWRFNAYKLGGNSSRSGIELKPAAANFK